MQQEDIITETLSNYIRLTPKETLLVEPYSFGTYEGKER